MKMDHIVIWSAVLIATDLQSPAYAQTIIPLPGSSVSTLVRATVSCPAGNGASPPCFYPEGVRTAVVESIIIDPKPDGGGFISGRYSANYKGIIRNGNLAYIDADMNYIGYTPVLRVSGEEINSLNSGGVPTQLQYIRNLKYSEVRQIYSNMNWTSDGFQYAVHTENPSVVTPNGARLTGTFSDTNPADGLVYGTVGGWATVPNSGTEMLVTNTIDQINVTTQVDGNGVITPRVAVTDGIDMNGSRISNLGSGVASGDAVNKGQLDDEAMTRAKADLQISQRIGAAESGNTVLAASLAGEMTARMASDNAIVGRLDAIGSRLDSIDSRLNQLDRRVSASTAVAVALGGTGFLPGMRFNLAGNVARYGGAHAGAIQLGVMVTKNVAVNAGVASGFDKGGKTAVRGGFILGW